jgi:hypothetical protein
MCEIVGSVILGGIVGGGATKLNWRRPLRVAIREGIRTQRKLAHLVASVEAETKQLVAEAKEELEHPGRPMGSPRSNQ